MRSLDCQLCWCVKSDARHWGDWRSVMHQSAWKVSVRVLVLLVAVGSSHAPVIGYGSYLGHGFVPGRLGRNLLSI